MNLAIVGSRKIKDLDISKYIHEKPDCIVSGGAIGIDTLAEEYARENGIKTFIIKPEYEKYGKGAPLKRNHTILEQSDKVLAFWDWESKGTKYTIDLAKKMGKELLVIPVNVKNQLS